MTFYPHHAGRYKHLKDAEGYAARNIIETKQIQQTPSGQVRVWEKDIQELRIIPASQFDKALHEIREVITA